MQENEIKEYLKRELDKGQLVNVLVDRVVEDTDMLNFIVTKYNGLNMASITRAKKVGLVKNYVENYKKYYL